MTTLFRYKKIYTNNDGFLSYPYDEFIYDLFSDKKNSNDDISDICYELTKSQAYNAWDASVFAANKKEHSTSKVRQCIITTDNVRANKSNYSLFIGNRINDRENKVIVIGKGVVFDKDKLSPDKQATRNLFIVTNAVYVMNNSRKLDIDLSNIDFCSREDEKDFLSALDLLNLKDWK